MAVTLGSAALWALLMGGGYVGHTVAAGKLSAKEEGKAAKALKKYGERQQRSVSAASAIISSGERFRKSLDQGQKPSRSMQALLQSFAEPGAAFMGMGPEGFSPDSDPGGLGSVMSGLSPEMLQRIRRGSSVGLSPLAQVYSDQNQGF